MGRTGLCVLGRAGPAPNAGARSWAAGADDLDDAHTFTLEADGQGHGVGPSGAAHQRFRAWKEDLRDSSEPFPLSP
jgi:hypothetical protein